MIKKVVFFFFLWVPGLVWATPPYQVFAYLSTTYVSNTRGAEILPANIPWSDLTRLYAFAAEVNSDTTISYNTLSAYYKNNLISLAHSNGERVYLTFGGAGNGQPANFYNATTPANLSGFIANIIQAVQQGDGQVSFDGVDIDWEYPTSSQESQVTTFFQNLSTALRNLTAYDGNPMGLDFFTSAGDNNCGFNWATLGNYVDNAIVSGYSVDTVIGGVDFDAPINVPSGYYAYDCENTPLIPASVGGNVAQMASLGFSKKQMILGCPLYIANGPNTDIYTVLKNGTANPGYQSVEMESIYSDYSSYSADDATAYCNKIGWALGQGMQGIALFELSQACPYADAPVTALWAAISNSSGCVVLPTATPTPTSTNTATPTNTNTPCGYPGLTCTFTNTPTPTYTGTPTFTPTVTPTPTATSPITSPVVGPNPTKGQPVFLYLPLNSPTNVKVQVFTLAFRKVWEQDYSQVTSGMPLSVSLSDKWGATLANGLYYVIAITNNGTYKTKLLILR